MPLLLPTFQPPSPEVVNGPILTHNVGTPDVHPCAIDDPAVAVIISSKDLPI
jgi:hypothetical protein